MAAGVSLIAFIATAAAVVGPWFYLSIHRVPGRPLTSTRTVLNVVVLLHLLYILYQIIVLPPDNIFTRLKQPLSTPPDVLRSILLSKSDTGELPAPLDTLLRHLGSYDMKTFYVRFGHNVVVACDYCHSFNDFGMFALADALLSYIWTAAVVGVCVCSLTKAHTYPSQVVTINTSGHERYRTLATAAIAACFFIEVYYVATSPIEVPRGEKPVFWVRRAFFASIITCSRCASGTTPSSSSAASPLSPSPSSYTFSPQKPPHLLANPTINATRISEQTLLRMQTLRLTRGAIMRIPLLRTRAIEWWEGDARAGQWVREDRAVQDMARQLGSGFDEDDGSASETETAAGPLRANARNAVGTLVGGFTPSEFWKPPS
ncbi:hypothetical protein MKEN_00583700 [Mycena kentingensis (nom. inval.)]|nr:hypothetical protein MKEN_00583700 [Mycena kentingensis (nom. inval.)]